MGLGMALNLQNHLKTTNQSNLRYSNRTISKGDKLKGEGGVPQADYAALVKSCDIIFTMVRTPCCPTSRSKAKSYVDLE